jgi:benzoyl-CoA reductase subunit C
MEVMQKFHDVVVNHHQYAQEYKKKTGRKVFGYLCSYTPEEILYAADILPVRVVGGHQPVAGITEPHISNSTCVFSRDILAQGLTGKYDYLDGIVLTHTCQQIQLVYHSWRLHVPTPYKYLMYFPTLVTSKSNRNLIILNLKEYARSLEEWLGKNISTEQLDNAIKVYNTNRRLLRKLYALRKDDSPPISGAEMMEVTVAGLFMDKAEHSKLLRQLLKEMPLRKSKNGTGKRIMILGSEQDDVELVKIIESAGAKVVIDELCTGSRNIWNDVKLKGDRFEALATRMIERPPCVAKDVPQRRRVGHVLQLARDYKVDAVITLEQMYCEPQQWDNTTLVAALAKQGIPTMRLETDIVTPSGPFRTRVEAFMETLDSEI